VSKTAQEEIEKSYTKNAELARDSCRNYISVCAILAGFSATFIVLLTNLDLNNLPRQTTVTLFLISAFVYVFSATVFANVSKTPLQKREKSS